MPAITGTEVAKLAVLAIRWPHLLSVLARGNLGRWERGEEVAGLEMPAALAGFLKTEPQIGPAADRLL
jgi:hypothetical protein